LWDVDPEGVLFLETAGRTETLSARRILLATGAFERPVPIAGWTLPGVMTAGPAQLLLKSSGLAPEGRVVLAGQGPLPYLGAARPARARAAPAALFETTPLRNYLKAMRPVAGLGGWRPRIDQGTVVDLGGQTCRDPDPARPAWAPGGSLRSMPRGGSATSAQPSATANAHSGHFSTAFIAPLARSWSRPKMKSSPAGARR